MAMKTLTIDMYHERECKGSHRYDAVNGQMAAINAVYIRKQDMGGAVPTKIQITVRDMDDAS